jgi:hypothetical protein
LCFSDSEEKAKVIDFPLRKIPGEPWEWSNSMDEGRKRTLAVVAGVLVARHLKTAEDLFGGSQGSPRTDAMVAAAVQWAERIMQKIDAQCPTNGSNRGNQK